MSAVPHFCPGWVAEVYPSNFQMIKWSFVVWFLSSILMLPAAILLVTVEFLMEFFMLF